MVTNNLSTRMRDSCPAKAQLRSFLNGDVDETALETISKHLEHCNFCLTVLDEQSNLPKFQIKSQIQSPFLEENNFFRFENRLLGLRIETGWVSSDDERSKGSEALIPTTLGRFSVKRLLGAGAFGNVFLAYDPLLKRNVAIKAPRTDKFKSEVAFASFLAEARHAAALEHPGIVPIYDVLQDDSGKTLIVMKFIKGQPLSSLLRDGDLTLDARVKIVKQVAKAVHFAHERGFVHRDLKPSNILIDEAGEAHVADFGLGLNLSDEIKDSNGRAGTPPYMSPEQVKHDVIAIDRRSDIWALGIILVESVHGKCPFSQRDRSKLFHAIKYDEPAIETTAETRSLDDIAKRCLEKSRVNRPDNAELLADDLVFWLKRNYPSGMSKWLHGWRRNFVIATGVFLSICAWWMAGKQIEGARIRSAIGRLESAPADQISGLLEELRDANASNRSIEVYPDSIERSGRLRLIIGEIALGGMERDLIERLADELEWSSPGEIAAMVDVLASKDASAEIGHEVIKRLSNTDERRMPNGRLAFAACLGGLLPQHQYWNEIHTEVAKSLTSLPQRDQESWLPLFDDVAISHLRKPLQQLMTDEKVPVEVQTSAAVALTRYLANDYSSLARLVGEAGQFELPVLVDALRTNQLQSLTELTKLFRDSQASQKPTQFDDETKPSVREVQAARISIALWLLGEPNALFDALRHEPNPTLQTLTIHGLAKQQIDIDQLLAQLEAASRSGDNPREVSIKFGLLQIIALCSPDSIDTKNIDGLVNDIWCNDSDAGVHSSARIAALRHDIELDFLTEGEHGNWLADQIGNTIQDFRIIEPCTAKVGIPVASQASRATIPWTWHTRVFPRRIALSLNEVTIEQFRFYNPEFRSGARLLRDSSSDAAMMMLDLNSAYDFCNRLSERRGLESCYDLKELDGKKVFVPKPNHLALSGYRLPTDGEWELACRAGTVSSRYFGNSDMLISQYGWVGENYRQAAKWSNRNSVQSQPVASFLPNRWGFFDMYGNAKEICDSSNDPIEPNVSCVDEFNNNDFEFRRDTPMLRGSALYNPGSIYAFSHSRTNKFYASTDSTIGLRLARTLVSNTYSNPNSD